MKHTMHYWLYVCILLTSIELLSKDFENDCAQNQQEQNESAPALVSISSLLNEAYRIMRQDNQQSDVISPQQLSALQLRFIQYHHSPLDTSEHLEPSDSDTD